MRKVTCDCCGKELSHSDHQKRSFDGAPKTVVFRGGGRELRFMATTKIVVTDKFIGDDVDDEEEDLREDWDLCSACAKQAFNKVEMTLQGFALVKTKASSEGRNG